MKFNFILFLLPLSLGIGYISGWCDLRRKISRTLEKCDAARKNWIAYQEIERDMGYIVSKMNEEE